MKHDLKTTFLSYIDQLHGLTNKIPERMFSCKLADDMLPLSWNAIFSANFLLRGLGPLIQEEYDFRKLEKTEKIYVLNHLEWVKSEITISPGIESLEDCKYVSENAGTNKVLLSQTMFIWEFILPNHLFHKSIVYAIARNNGAVLSKGDFDGIHQFDKGFKLPQIKG